MKNRLTGRINGRLSLRTGGAGGEGVSPTFSRFIQVSGLFVAFVSGDKVHAGIPATALRD